MNSRQKLVQQAYLDDEEAVIKNLKSVYNQSLKDITEKSNALQKDIEKLAAMYDEVEDEAEKARLQSMQRSKVYQKQYQDALKKQVSDILDTMQEEEFKTVASYLDQCYEQGFLGTMYDLQGQGIPLCFPLDQEAMVRAVQLDSKISQGLYSRLGEDVDLLKKNIAAQVSRGISTGMTYGQVAQQLAGCTNIGFNNAVRIARTEGHRIQCQAGMDACYKAKEKGADVVKQWDATLDGATRESHVHVDGEIKELDEKFSNGLRFPGDPSGGAAEVVNCRCALLQRARWAVGDSFTKMNNVSKEIVDFSDIDNYKQFKKTYLNKANELTKYSKNGNMSLKSVSKGSSITLSDKQFGKKIGKHAKDYGLSPQDENDREELRSIILDIIDNHDDYAEGEWRGQSEAVKFYIKGEDVVVINSKNEFVTILKGGVNNARVKKAREPKV